MKNIWVISDTHFGHENILRFMDNNGNHIRPFDNVNQMNEYMIEKWNSAVKPGDKVYHLGDVFFGDKENFKKLWPKLYGSKTLIVGNHDDIKWLSSGGFFKNVHMWRMFPEHGLLFSHVPVDRSIVEGLTCHKDKRFLNVHGHIHNNPSPTGYHFNVSVEWIDYTPWNIEEIQNAV